MDEQFEALGKSRSRITDLAIQHGPGVLQEPSPVLRVSALAGSSVNLDVRPWVAVADHGPVGGELNRSILERFRRQDISIPFPQREVRVLGSGS
jgi:small conductance mechanosensitive channel